MSLIMKLNFQEKIMTKKLTTVIDCNVIISAGITDGNCRKVIADILQNHQNYLCEEILLEYRDVINRDKFIPYKSRLLSLIEIICEQSILVLIADVNLPLNNIPNLPDSGDEIYLRTAISGHCDFIITGNLKDFPQLKYDHIRIMSPGDFLSV